MAYENIRLRKQNFTVVEGYFWMVDEDTDSVVVKTDDGSIAFSYPLDTTITETVKSLEYDGYNIWTLRATDTDEVTIDRWYISNYVFRAFEYCFFFSLFNLSKHLFFLVRTLARRVDLSLLVA